MPDPQISQVSSDRLKREDMRVLVTLETMDGWARNEHGLRAEIAELRAGISWARGMCTDGAPHERIDHFLGCVLAGKAQPPREALNGGETS